MAKLDYYVTFEGDCPNCEGKGHLPPEAHCTVCGYVLTGADLDALPSGRDAQNNLPAVMPCGHIEDYLDDYRWCVECEGTGHISKKVTLEQALAALGLVAEPMAK